MIFPQRFHGVCVSIVFMVLPQDFHGASMGLPRCFHCASWGFHTPMVLQLDFHGACVGFPWYSHGPSTVVYTFSWCCKRFHCFHGVSMGLPWCCLHGTPMVLPWHFSWYLNGSFMRLASCFHDTSMVPSRRCMRFHCFHGTFVIVPWFSRYSHVASMVVYVLPLLP